jgi:ABC-type transport system substrate-binding protein
MTEQGPGAGHMNDSRRWGWKGLFVAGMACCCLILAFGCDKSKAPEQSRTEKGGSATIVAGGTYRAPLLNNPSTLDPVYVQDDYGATIVTQIFDGLVQFNPELYVVPDLAATWSVEDGGATYRFTLRSAKFHDGTPVTAADVAFSLSRLFRADPEPFILSQLLKVKGAEAYRTGAAETVAGFEMVDAKTLVVRLTEPYAPFLTALGMYQAKIVPKALVSRDPKLFGRQPVGSGPFRFVKWEQDQAIILERFDDYFSTPALLSDVFFNIYPGGKADVVLADFLAGRLDEMPVYGSVREDLSKQADLQWLHRPSLSLLFYGFNCRSPLLQDARVRSMLSAAIDREKLVQQVYGGQFEPAVSILPPGMPGYQPQSAKFSRNDQDRSAFEALVGATPERPFRIEIVSAVESDQSKAEMAFIQKAWARLGAEVQLKFIPDWSKFESYISSDAVQVYRYVWFADIPDPDNFLNPLFGSHSSANYMKYHDPTVDTDLLKALTMTDAVQRAELYRGLEQRILAAAPMAPLFYLASDRVYKPLVRGVELSALGFAYSSLAGVHWASTGTK